VILSEKAEILRKGVNVNAETGSSARLGLLNFAFLLFNIKIKMK
jgi:hypothetical protein